MLFSLKLILFIRTISYGKKAFLKFFKVRFANADDRYRAVETGGRVVAEEACAPHPITFSHVNVITASENYYVQN